MFSSRLQSAAKALSQSASRSLFSQASRVPSFQFSRLASSTPAFATFSARRLLSTSVVRNDYGGEAPRRRHNGSYAAEEIEPSSTIFVANVPFIAEEDDIRLAFEQFGEIEAVRINSDNGRSKGSARITFASPEIASKVLDSSSEQPVYIFDRPTRLEFARARPQRAPAPPSDRLFVVDWSGSDRDLRSLFGHYEEDIENIYFPKDRATGARAGTAFVRFSSVEVATKALEAVSEEEGPDGPLKVFYARPPQNEGFRQNEGSRQDFRGGRGGGGGGGRRRDFARSNDRY